MDLTLYHAELLQVLQIIHHLFGIETAVFDDFAVLVTGSPGYLDHKGSTVHKPSIMEVIENDEVIVLRPGEMRSCIVCRFSSTAGTASGRPAPPKPSASASAPCTAKWSRQT